MPQSPSIAPSSVEAAILEHSKFEETYAPQEKMRAFVVESFPMLGKVIAYRFIEWALLNPSGVCALPTGKTPEYFIKWVQKIVANWDDDVIAEDRREFGLQDFDAPPKFDKLWFVQLDEFYPIDSEQHNSFKYYVNRYYIQGFGLDPERCLLIDSANIGLEEGESWEAIWPSDGVVDLSLRLRAATSVLEGQQQAMIRKVDQWCCEYENKIRELGGIGFFLGGIGPDGHIAFNCAGVDHREVTRLTAVNYETQAAAAGDLGGIDAVKAKAVITIGLGTITYNPDCVCIIMAAGEAKAKVVADGIQKKTDVMHPSHALRCLPRASFFLTAGAAKLLTARRVVELQRATEVPEQVIEKVLVDLALAANKRLVDLTMEDASRDQMANALVEKLVWSEETLQEKCAGIRDVLVGKIDKAIEPLLNTRFLHTEPHHDDIILGYLPAVIRNSRTPCNEHHFVCATSGFNSVSNKHMSFMVKIARAFTLSATFKRLRADDYFCPKPAVSSDSSVISHYETRRARDVWQFLDGVAARSKDMKDEGGARRFIRSVVDIFEIPAENRIALMKTKLEELDHYLATAYCGQPDSNEIQLLKGSCREFEAECVWGFIGWLPSNVEHLRLGFYTADIFTPEPTLQRDAQPLLDVMERTQPDIVTVAFDPEASGPDTHYKVLQAVTAAVHSYQSDQPKKEVKVWGYRNVWYRFETHDVTHILPSSLASLSSLDRMFMESFESQKAAEFPSYELNGPFSDLAASIQVSQYQQLKTCLGRSWFQEHPNALIRATKGLVFLKEMSVPELESHSRQLKSAAERY